MKKFGPSDVKRIRSAVASLVDEYHLPGIAVGLVSDRELVYAEGFGYADIESGRPQAPSLRQRIGSITKTMVGLCAMALVDEGKLSLDDRVSDRLPDLKLRGPAETLAVRHLMTHTSGIGEAPTMDDFADPWGSALWSESPDVPGFREAYSKGIVIEAPPDTKWAYANHAFALLGEIVARTEGQPIEDVLRRRVFEPLGMENTDCLDQPHANLTTPYHRAPGHDERDILELLGKEIPSEKPVDGYNIRGRYQYIRPRAAGAVQSTIPDMAKYASALLNAGGGIVRPSTFEAMLTPHWQPDKRMSSMGLTFFMRQRFGRSTFGHGGGIVGGWNTQITVVPEERLAVLVHMNLSLDTFYRIDGRIFQAVLNTPTQTLPSRATDPALLKSAPGVYEPTPGPLTNFRTIRTTGRVQITARDGELMLRSRRGQWREGVRMVPADPSDPAFFTLDTGEPEPPQLALALDGRGQVTGFLIERFTRMVRNDALKPWAV